MFNGGRAVFSDIVIGCVGTGTDGCPGADSVVWLAAGQGGAKAGKQTYGQDVSASFHMWL